MNALIVAVLATLAVASAAPSGHGTIVAGPSGIVTGAGAIGPAGHGLGLGLGGLGLGAGLGLAHGGAVLAAPAATAVVAGPAAGLGLGLGLGAVGLGHAGVRVQGPLTVPAVISGPSGHVAAAGLWGPTLAHGHGGHGW